VWREKLLGLDPEVQFHDPASAEALAQLERAISVPVPRDLVALLSETNGVSGQYGLGLVWSADRILRDNESFRTSADFGEVYMPFDPLLFFADAGNGDQFAFPITAAGARNDVFVWDHEDDSRRWYAASLEQYLAWWLSGERGV
jgi:SMI1 / KNR4 family (SUKH-1)